MSNTHQNIVIDDYAQGSMARLAEAPRARTVALQSELRGEEKA